MVTEVRKAEKGREREREKRSDHWFMIGQRERKER